MVSTLDQHHYANKLRGDLNRKIIIIGGLKTSPFLDQNPRKFSFISRFPIPNQQAVNNFRLRQHQLGIGTAQTQTPNSAPPTVTSTAHAPHNPFMVLEQLRTNAAGMAEHQRKVGRGRGGRALLAHNQNPDQ